MPAYEDDPFERAARREAEIAEELAQGRLNAEQAEQLRDLAASTRTGDSQAGPDDIRSRLDLRQLRRVLDEGVDPAVLACALRVMPAAGTDEIIDLLVDFAPEAEFFQALESGELGHLDYRSVATLLEYDIEPADLQRLIRAGVSLSAKEAAELCEVGADLGELGRELAASDLRPSAAQLIRMTAEGTEISQVAQLVELGVSIDQAIDLAGSDVDPEVVRRLLDEGVEIDWEQLADSGPRSGWSGSMIGLKSRHRHVGLIFGNHVVGSDATVSGAVLGSVTVLSGVRARIESWVLGDVVVQPHASVVISGSVRGRVRNLGGQVEVTGSVHGGIVADAQEAV